MTSIDNILRINGPMLSSRLIEILVKQAKISPGAARQRLSRAKLPVTKIKGLWADNQAFYHLQEQYKKEEFYDSLLESFKDSGKKYYSIINSISFHYGYILENQLSSYSNSPTQNLKGHKKYDNLINELLELDLIYKDNDYYRVSPYLFPLDNFRHSKGIEVAKNLILLQFSDWSRKIGLTSYETSTLFSQFGKFNWGFVSPSYIASLTSFNKEKNSIIPAYIVADILIGNKIEEKDVQFFINKVEVVKQLRNMPKFIPFLIVDDLELPALKLLKSKGIVIGFIKQLFGNEYKELLKSLINVVTNAGAILKKNPEAYLDLISKLNKLVTGKTSNLRGDLFELAVGYYHSRFSNIDIGKIITHDGEQREIDVLANYGNEIVICECKGYKNPIEVSELKEWLSKKVPVIRNWILAQHYLKNRPLKFEFWSSGGFNEDSKQFIGKFMKAPPKKYSVEFIDDIEMIKKASETNSKKFKDILKEYYLKEL